MDRDPGETRGAAVSQPDGEPPLDPEHLGSLRALAARNPEGVAEIVSLYFRDARGRIDLLRGASAAGDEEAIVRVAHSLKGSSAGLSARTLAALCAELEQLTEDESAINATIDRIDEEFGRVSKALSDVFGVPIPPQ